MRELADLTSQLVAIDSVNPDLVPGGAGEGAMARVVAAWLERAGLEVTLEDAAPGRPNVIGVARGSGGGRSLLLNAHMDTVGVAGMERPFAPSVEGQRLYGRGACDMKASLAAIMLAGAAVRRQPLRGDVLVTAVVDEEYASIGTQALAQRWHADAAIVTEPTALEIGVAHKGFIWMDVETRGVAAHGSRPDLGVDAIARMGPVLVGLEALDHALRAAPGHPLLGTGSVHAGLISGGQEMSSYPLQCRLGVERRTIPGETAEVVAAEMRALLERLNVDATVATTLVREPFEVAPDAEIVATLRREAAAALGDTPVLAGASGWMDSALLAAAGIPTVIFGPGGAGLHAVVEWVDLAQAAQCYEILVATARAFCA